MNPPRPVLIEKRFLSCPPSHRLPGQSPGGPLDDALWIWHPEAGEKQAVFLKFLLSFEVGPEDCELLLHYAADQFAELKLDGALFARGPEASPVEACSFSSFRVSGLAPGQHVLEVFAWWLGTEKFMAPLARETLGPGFVLAAEGPFAERLSTGRAPWGVCLLRGWSMDTARGFAPAFGVGGGLCMDLRVSPGDLVPAAPRWSPFRGNDYGVRDPRYRLRPARLPEQLLRPAAPGRVRAVLPGCIVCKGESGQPHLFADAGPADARCILWNRLWREGVELTLPAKTSVSVLIDLEDYFCGFPEWTLSGGLGAELHVLWAESLEELRDGPHGAHKGHRDEIGGKCIRGVMDRFFPDQSANQLMRPHWWRAGRYLLLRIRTGENALTLHRFRILETRYPLDITGSFSCDQDTALNPVKALCLRGLQMCMHETYIDCPYYEQLMYVFDTRLEILTTYVLSHDDKLPRRAIELFDLSRGRFDGLCCSRFPCFEDQLIPMFSLCWTWMVRDYLYWRGDPGWLLSFLPGIRGIHARFEALENADGLLGPMPGWNYGDWVQAWPGGKLPETDDGVSCILNLVYVHSLRQLADVEDALGDPRRASICRQKALRLSQQIRLRFWRKDAGLLADDDTGAQWSQHAQIWGVLSGTLRGRSARRAMKTALTDPALQPASYMLRSHLFDALAEVGLGGEILPQLDAWREMAAKGARSGFEHLEPTRSDCHAWSSHPLYHLPATVLGIRPARPGFAAVRIAPQPGGLKEASATLPHPRGEIRAALRFEGGDCSGEVHLPDGVSGVVCWKGMETLLKAGANRVDTR